MRRSLRTPHDTVLSVERRPARASGDGSDEREVKPTCSELEPRGDLVAVLLLENVWPVPAVQRAPANELSQQSGVSVAERVTIDCRLRGEDDDTVNPPVAVRPDVNPDRPENVLAGRDRRARRPIERPGRDAKPDRPDSGTGLQGDFAGGDLRWDESEVDDATELAQRVRDARLKPEIADALTGNPDVVCEDATRRLAARRAAAQVANEVSADRDQIRPRVGRVRRTGPRVRRVLGGVLGRRNHPRPLDRRVTKPSHHPICDRYKLSDRERLAGRTGRR
jgi:hypothetical protein